jgi:hypothetical protein
MKFSVKRVKVKTNFQDKDAANLLTSGRGVETALTGSTVFTTPTIPPTILKTQLNEMESVMNLIAAGDTREANYQLLNQKADIVMASLAADGHYVEDIANSIAAGDEAHAKQLILSAAYELKAERKLSPRTFEVVDTGSGWAHFRVKKTSKDKEANLWRYGLTTEKEKKPDSLILLVDAYVDIIITGLPGGAIVAMQHAGSELSGKVKKNGHPSYDYNNSDPYEWTDFIYVVIP